MTPQQHLLRGAIHAYRYGLRPLIGCNCRFLPHCSDYALEAVATHGALRGAWLSGRRVLRCNPWHPGGHDPVPPVSAGPVAAPLSAGLSAATKGSSLP
jgi:putative membrane protein insertion efficiency factor